MNIFVFDIETILDISSAKQIYKLHDLSDEDVVNALQQMRRQESGGSEFFRLHLQKIVAISVVLRHHNQLKVWSLGDPHSSEAEIIQRFFAGIEKYTPTLVSWNGSGFDLPVIHYRALLHGITAPKYWSIGEEDNNFRYNNYLNRFHYRHMDIMDILAGYQNKANAPLDQIAAMLGFPGKMGMSGSKVFESYQQGKIIEIRNYCETDVLNTYLIFLRFELLRGKLSHQNYEDELQKVREMLVTESKPHLNEFLAAWNMSEA